MDKLTNEMPSPHEMVDVERLVELEHEWLVYVSSQGPKASKLDREQYLIIRELLASRQRLVEARELLIDARFRLSQGLPMHLTDRIDAWLANGEGYMSDPFKPSAGLLCKLSSIAVHADKGTGSDSHHFDITALRQILSDPKVKTWMQAMDKLAMLPKKRKP